MDSSPTSSFRSIDTSRSLQSSGSDSNCSASSKTSAASRELLFGEIDTSNTKSLRPNGSLCNLTLSSDSRFLKFWLSDRMRNLFLSHVEDKQDLARLRLVCHDFSAKLEPYLFKAVSVTFRAGTFTKVSRIAALERIGHHIESFTLNAPHTTETILPPLIHPTTGDEITFMYKPQVHAPKTFQQKIQQPKYGSWEMNDLLIRQYPSIFHAATNVPAFIRGLSALENLQHLTISCPRKAPSGQSRPSIVDYVLISMRIAVELAPLNHLRHLSLLPIHPTGLFYLQPVCACGSSPKSLKRWSQIEKVTMRVEYDLKSHDKEQNVTKLLHTYLRNFASSLTKFDFQWDGCRGPCPLPLDKELPPSSWNFPHSHSATQTYSQSQSSPVTPPGSSHSASSRDERQRRPRGPPRIGTSTSGHAGVRFRRLQEMDLRNATMSAAQVSAFIVEHRRTMTQFNFEDVKLSSGTWDEALSPLSRITGHDAWKAKASAYTYLSGEKAKSEVEVEVMEVPIILSDDHGAFFGRPAKMKSTVFETLASPIPTTNFSNTEKPLPDKSPPLLCRWLARVRARRTALKPGKNSPNRGPVQLVAPPPSYHGRAGGECIVKTLLRSPNLGWH